MRPKVETPSLEEEAAIQRGIAEDPDAPELTDAQLAAMRPAAEIVPHLVRNRGKPPASVKMSVAISLDADLVQALQAHGPGWQTRVNALLRAALNLEAP